MGQRKERCGSVTRGGRIPVSLLALMVSAVAGLVVFRSPSRKPALPAPYERGTQAVRGPDPVSQVADSERFLGIIVPFEAVDVSAKIEGQIVQIRGRMGDHVAAGSILAKLDSPSLTAADVTMAEAELQITENQHSQMVIELAQARERLGRAESLSDQHLLTHEQLADVRYQERLAAAREMSAASAVSQKRVQVEQRKAMLANLDVRAPFEGQIAARYVERGTRVGPGVPIMRLVQTYPLRLRFAVPSAQTFLLEVGCPIAATVDDVNVELSGTITRLAPEVDNTSQMLIVEGIVTAPDRVLPSNLALAGRVARVSLPAAGVRTATDRHGGR